MRINVRVRHGKGEIKEVAEGIEIFTSEPMENNRANVDIIRQLARKYGVNSANVRIISGASKRRKIIEIEK